ncbi:MAG TPA: type IV toxin-antitoxin system AbiEi family antitoxin domain-containing protein [Solirubrobacteraceae bacterium]
MAAQQGGVFSLAQLVDLGLTASAIHKRAKRGRLYRVHQAVYSIAPPELLSRNGRFMAAVLACGPGALLSHRSAAELHDLLATARSGIDVTVPNRSCHVHQGIDLHRSTTLTPADTAIVDGIPCTTLARTALDLAAVSTQRRVERALTQGEILGKLDANALEDQLHRNAKTAAARNLRGALDAVRGGPAPTWSVFEEQFLALCRRAGVPPPEVNAWVMLDDGEPAIRADFVWRDQRVVIETDGHRYHNTRWAFETDRRRDQRLTLAGWRVVRVTWRQLTQDPARIQALLSGLLRPG